MMCVTCKGTGKIPNFVSEVGHWIIWQHTTDFIHGTYLVLYDNGRIERVTSRDGEGDDVHVIREGD